MPKDDGIGAATLRREDVRFLTGRGRYTDDINLPGQAHVHFLRSTVAHGRLGRVDATAAAAGEGVIRIFTGEDFEGIGGLPCGWQVTDRHGNPMQEPPHPVLAQGKVRHVGDPIAAVVAETLEQARDAAELIEVEIDELPAATDMRAALADDAVKVHDDLTSNLCYDWGFIDDNRDAVDAAIRDAHHVTTLDLVNNRLVPNAMEPRAAIGDYNPATDEHTLYTTSQNPHVIRLLMGAFVLGIPEHKLRVVAPDVGGGFGSKIYHYAEEAFCTFAAKAVNRAVKWTADRSEAFVTDAHGRDHETRIELALDENGKFLAIRTDTLANMGAYLSTFAPSIPTYLHGTLMAGNYTTPVIHVNVKAVFTNTVPVDAYRGAGRPEATFQLERVIDKAAHELGIDPIDLRRRNFIRKDQFPYATPVAVEYDTGDYEATMDKLEEIADLAGFAGRRERKRAERTAPRAGRRPLHRGLRHRAVGAGGCARRPGGALRELHGQGQCHGIRECADRIPQSRAGARDDVSPGRGRSARDRRRTGRDRARRHRADAHGHGHVRVAVDRGRRGRRSCGAVEKVIAKGRKIAAHLMEAAEGDVEFADGAFSVAGTDKSVPWGDVCLAAYVPHNYPIEEIEPGLEETAFYDPANFTYPAGAYACEVEVDPETGAVEICSFSAADDFGNVINPMIVDGQVHGGLAQGIGQALLESAVYDENGQLLSGNFMDYAMPRADDLPSFTVDHSCQTPCTHNPLGVKGLRRGRRHRVAAGGRQRGRRRIAGRRVRRRPSRHARDAIQGMVGNASGQLRRRLCTVLISNSLRAPTRRWPPFPRADRSLAEDRR